MDLRFIATGALAGVLAGSLVGVAEALYVVTSGAPDALVLFYAVVLYGLIGLPMGIGCGVLAAAADRVRRVPPWLAWAGAFCAVGSALGLVILQYVVNKVVFAEQGVGAAGMAGILVALVLVDALVLTAARSLADGPVAALSGPKGFGLAWGALAAVTGVASVAGGAPSPSFAHGKGVPKGLEGAPNVLFVMVDTLRADALGAYGGVETPAFDAFARDAVLFEQAFAGASWTRSAGATLWTSQLPSGHNADTKASRLSDDAVTFAEPLREKGVTTGALVNNINMTATFNFDQGFDSFVYEAPAYRFGGTESVFGLSMYKLVLKVAEKVSKHKSVEHYYQPADVVLGDALRFAEANRDARWALFVHLMEPHDPYFEHPSIDGTGSADFNGKGFARGEVEHPDPSQADYLRRVYHDEVRLLDRHLTGFFAELKKRGLYDDTLIVFTADHGEEFYEHGGWWHGTTLYDEQIHVPLVVKLPGNALAGTRVPWQVRTIDVAPTITGALGLAPDPSWSGQDLLPDVRQWGAEPPEADARTHPRDRVVVAEEDFEGNVLSAIRKDGFKYIRANAGNPRGLAERELYDVIVDPGEMKNLLPAADVAGLDGDLEVVLKGSAEGAVHGGTATRSAAECEQLKALGYLADDEPC